MREAADELGYRPDPTARSLRTRRSGVVGVVVPDLTNPVLPPIVRGIEETLWGAGIACLLADTDNDLEREAVARRRAARPPLRGLIVASATRERPSAPEGVPTVLVTRDIDGSGLPLVAADDAAGVRAAVAHLRELGHERIAHVTGPPVAVDDRAAARARSAPSRAATRRSSHGDAFTIPAGERACGELLRGGWDGTAIVAGNDMIALGVLRGARRGGPALPRPTSPSPATTTCRWSTASQPPLTTVAIPQYEIGVTAARLLLARLRGGTARARARAAADAARGARVYGPAS